MPERKPRRKRRLRMPQCPYCGGRLNPAQAWVLRRRGEYVCPRCGGLSNVVPDPLLYGLGYLAILVATAFFIAGLFLNGHFLLILGGTFFPFFLFYCLSVFLIRLKKPVRRRIPRAGFSRQMPENGSRRFYRTVERKQPGKDPTREGVPLRWEIPPQEEKPGRNFSPPMNLR